MVSDVPKTHAQREFLERYASFKEDGYFEQLPDMDFYGKCVRLGQTRMERNGMTVGWPAHGYGPNRTCTYCGYPQDPRP